MEFVPVVKIKEGNKTTVKYGAAGTTKELGNTEENTMQVRLQRAAKSEEAVESKKESSRTGAHEYGHAIGLKHLYGDPGVEQGSVETVSGSPDNLMRQARHGTGTEITTKQLKKAEENVDNR